MTEDKLTQTINQSIKELGFARIARAGILDVFSNGNPASFDIHKKIEEFASNQGFKHEYDGEDFVIFRASNTD